MGVAAQITFKLPASFLDGRGERAGFALLAAFLVTFMFIRTSARLIRSHGCLVDRLECAARLLAILKGRPFLGLLGIFIPPVSIPAACRLAAPGSPWARRLYTPHGHKLARAQSRFARARQRHRRLADAFAGAPSEPDAAPVSGGDAEDAFRSQPAA